MEPSCARSSVDPEIFFTVDRYDRPDLTAAQRDVVNTKRLRAARRVCEHCPVRAQCLERNLLEPVGVYAGLTPLARAELALGSGRTLTRPDDIDLVAVERRIAGDTSTFLTPKERREAIRRMDRRGHTRPEITQVTSASHQTISAALAVNH